LLPIANGGTGQTTANAAFQALTPATTKGDIVSATATGAQPVRVAVSSNDGTPLKARSAANGGVDYAGGFVPGDIVAIANLAAGGSLGTAPATVDIAAMLTVNQTTAGQAMTLANPTQTAGAHQVVILNVGTASFTLLGTVVLPAQSILVFWSGTAWSVVTAPASAKVRSQNASAQSIPNNASTVVTGWTNVFDRTAAFNAATGVFTAPVAGQYLVSAKVQFNTAAWTLAQFVRVSIRQNAVIQENGELAAQATASFPMMVQAASLINCAAGDTIDIAVLQNQGGAVALTAVAVNNSVSIVQVA
jgi:hypothetical protein